MQILPLLLTGLAVAVAETKTEGGQQWAKSAKAELSYVTRPDLRPQSFNVTTHRPDLVTPGYFFLSPFDRGRDRSVRHTFVPAQIGPHIYDGNGDLVWSGAYMFDQRNSYNFEVSTRNGEQVMSLGVYKFGDIENPDSQGCTGVILNSNYEIEETVMARGDSDEKAINMHEFKLVDDGKHALVIDVKRSPKHDHPNQKFNDGGFQEIDVATGEKLFEWRGSDYVPDGGRGDPYHVNSVDKSDEGNYLVSMRHQSTLYYISGEDGSIIWQLGGKDSSFVHVDDFTFHYQHHARVYRRNETHITVTFLNNDSWESEKQPESRDSAAFAVTLSLAETPMKATLERSWQRPDGFHSWRRGAVQVLPNEHAMVAWGEWGYMSEFTWDGELIQEIRFNELRFDDYRAFKLNFTGYSNEPIAVVSRLQGASVESVMTTVYVSWNGATEVASWNFYQPGVNGSDAVWLGQQNRTGFETTFMVPGYHENVFAEAISKDGKSMQNSSVEATSWPPHFSTEQHDLLQSYIDQGREMESQSGGELSTAAVIAVSAVLGVLIGAAGASLALILARRHAEKRVHWARVPNPVLDPGEVDEMDEEDREFLTIKGKY